MLQQILDELNKMDEEPPSLYIHELRLCSDGSGSVFDINNQRVLSFDTPIECLQKLREFNTNA